MTVNSLSEIAAVIKGVKRTLICGHISPDGDCLGSALTLALALKGLGIEAVAAGPDPVPEIYSFLPGAASFHVGSPPVGDFDAMITVDCPEKHRLGREYQGLPEKISTVISLDHHQSLNLYGTYNYIDQNAAAVGEIVYDLLQLMGIGINHDLAVCLYTAILTDTGSFRYENTTADTHIRTAGLLQTGAPLNWVNTLIYEEKPLAAHLLLKEALKTLEISKDGKVAWLSISREALDAIGAKDEHSEGVVNSARSIKGVEIGILFHEQADGRVKVSFRSKHEANVDLLAQKFGGGGHKRASGCTVTGDLSTVMETVLDAALTFRGDGPG